MVLKNTCVSPFEEATRQHNATYCNTVTLQRMKTRPDANFVQRKPAQFLFNNSADDYRLQQTATRCNALQHSETTLHCNIQNTDGYRPHTQTQTSCIYTKKIVTYTQHHSLQKPIYAIERALHKHTYMYTQKHNQAQTRARARAHTHTRTHVHTRARTHIHTRTHTHVHTRTHIHTHTQMPC